LQDGDEVPAHGNWMRVAEPEIAFVMRSDLIARATAYSLDEVMHAVGALHPSLEIPNSRYSVFTVVGEAQLLADNACAHQFILGPQAPESWRDIDLSKHAVHAQVTASNGAVWKREGTGAAVLGDPRIALTWLVNELTSQEISLYAGQFVTTGTCMTPLELNPGDHVDADFGVLGRVGLRFK
jgi:2-keto-4-pentenoate hydratase